MIGRSHRALARRMNKLPMKALENETFLEILGLLFTEEEATILAKAPIRPSSAEIIAHRAGRPVGEIRPILDRLARQGLLVSAGDDGERKYFVMAYLPGVFEYYTVMGEDDEKKRRFARLHEQYYSEEYARQANKKTLYLSRVIPIETAITPQVAILPGDSYREAVLRHDYWAVAPCACKKQNALNGHGCDKPLEVCLQFGNAGRGAVRTGFSRELSRTEMIDIIDQTEEAGLVHVTDNVEYPHLSCNCCGCCCDALAVTRRFNMPTVIAMSRYRVVYDAEKCKSCGQCVKYCPVEAQTIADNRHGLAGERCIGCGVCVSKCRHHALEMELKPDPRPVPENYGQMIVTGATQLMGIDSQVYSMAPRFSRMMGDWIQGGMDKGMERRKRRRSPV